MSWYRGNDFCEFMRYEVRFHSKSFVSVFGTHRWIFSNVYYGNKFCTIIRNRTHLSKVFKFQFGSFRLFEVRNKLLGPPI